MNNASSHISAGFRRIGWAKRAMDVCLAVLMIILSAPIMLFCAIGVRLSSEGPILFRQRRVGMHGREFVMLKFRSMRRDGASEVSWSCGIDKRKTRFGNLMRMTSLDELPQLFNVIRGDMSLVGPRPELAVFAARFERKIPKYALRHSVRPGMTGLAQIRGLRGDTSIVDRVEADLYYIDNWSIWLDIRILLATPSRILNRAEKYTGDKADKKRKR